MLHISCFIYLHFSSFILFLRASAIPTHPSYRVLFLPLPCPRRSFALPFHTIFHISTFAPNRSAESFVSRADVIGLTEQMPLTLAMFLFAIPAARQHLFVWRADNHDIDGSSSSSGSRRSGSSSWSSSSTSSSSRSSSSSSSSSSASGSSRSGCWQFRRQSEVGAVPAPKEAHTRAVAYPSAPTPSEVTLARARNRLDLSLYAHAAEVHSKLRATYQLCSDQPVHGE